MCATSDSPHASETERGEQLVSRSDSHTFLHLLQGRVVAARPGHLQGTGGTGLPRTRESPSGEQTRSRMRIGSRWNACQLSSEAPLPVQRVTCKRRTNHAGCPLISPYRAKPSAFAKLLAHCFASPTVQYPPPAPFLLSRHRRASTSNCGLPHGIRKPYRAAATALCSSTDRHTRSMKRLIVSASESLLPSILFAATVPDP